MPGACSVVARNGVAHDVEEKKRVLPMFFFRRVSVDRFRHFHDRHAVGVGVAPGCRLSAASTGKKLREGVDTLKNRD